MINKIHSIFDKINEFQYTHQYEIFFTVVLVSILIIVILKYIPDKNSENQTYYEGLQFTRSKQSLPILKKVKCKKLHEKKCRDIVERIFNAPFPSARPDFLKNKFTNKNLELDMYNSHLKLSIEYMGTQHYKYTPYFHKTYKDFLLQKERDNMKKKCVKIKELL